MGEFVFFGFLALVLGMWMFFPDHFRKVNQVGWDNTEKTKKLMAPAAKVGLSILGTFLKRR